MYPVTYGLKGSCTIAGPSVGISFIHFLCLSVFVLFYVDLKAVLSCCTLQCDMNRSVLQNIQSQTHGYIWGLLATKRWISIKYIVKIHLYGWKPSDFLFSWNGHYHCQSMISGWYECSHQHSTSVVRNRPVVTVTVFIMALNLIEGRGVVVLISLYHGAHFHVYITDWRPT